jgi:glutamine kinase
MHHVDGWSTVSKARMLSQAASRIVRARVLPLEIFTVAEWQNDAASVEQRIYANSWASGPVVVRSSALGEDSIGDSAAGRYASVLNVLGQEHFRKAIEKVRQSYGEPARDADEIFVQPMLERALASGVATSVDLSGGGHYRVVTWANGPKTDAVTAGYAARLRNWRGVDPAPGWDDHPIIGRVLACIREIEFVFGFEAFEIEFGVDAEGELVLFQIREFGATSLVAKEVFYRAMEVAASQAAAASRRDKRILGDGLLLGAMTDWNPAELIGLRPMPLARSLYRRMITDVAWSERRAEYGYRDLRGIPLMIDLAGHVLIDVRASLTSLVPARLPADVAARLVNAYAERLRCNPTLHDKVEFEIAVTCMSFDASERLQSYIGEGLGEEDVSHIEAALRELTKRISRDKLVEADMQKVGRLAQLRADATSLPPLQKVHRLLRDAVSWGTIPFGGLARCSFVATHILRSAVAAGVLSHQDVSGFFGSLSMPSKRLRYDFTILPREEFLFRYGHLRPGTYDIRLPRYDDVPDQYFSGVEAGAPSEPIPVSEMPAHIQADLDQGLRSLGLGLSGAAFLRFARAAIEAREWAKYEFSHNISDALHALTRWGRSIGLEPHDLACLTCEDLEQVSMLQGVRARAAVRARIAEAERDMQAIRSVSLPVLLRWPSECLAFEAIEGQPNFVTQRRVVARVACIDRGEDPGAAIVAVPNADPGYDWIFARGITGLITAFGGPNSHMAVRALENSIPAAIGCGPLEYARLTGFRVVELDAGARFVRGIS